MLLPPGNSRHVALALNAGSLLAHRRSKRRFGIWNCLSKQRESREVVSDRPLRCDSLNTANAGTPSSRSNCSDNEAVRETDCSIAHVTALVITRTVNDGRRRMLRNSAGRARAQAPQGLVQGRRDSILFPPEITKGARALE